jgi:hypothetical protein
MFRGSARRLRSRCKGTNRSGGVLALDPLPNEVNEFGWRKWLHAEGDVETFILVFGIGKAAEDDNRYPVAARAQTTDELGTAGAGHDVIGNHEANVLAGGAQQGQSAFRGSSDGDAETGIAKNGLANLQLNGIIVNQKNLAQNAGSRLGNEWSEAARTRIGPEF